MGTADARAARRTRESPRGARPSYAWRDCREAVHSSPGPMCDTPHRGGAFSPPRYPSRVASVRTPAAKGEMMPTDDGERAAIEITAPTLAQAQRLAAKMNGFETEVVPGGSYTVRVTPEGETRERLVALFDAIGSWLTSSGLTSSKISFGDNAIVVLPA